MARSYTVMKHEGGTIRTPIYWFLARNEVVYRLVHVINRGRTLNPQTGLHPKNS